MKSTFNDLDTKLIVTVVHSESIDSTESGTQRNLKSLLNSLNHRWE